MTDTQIVLIGTREAADMLGVSVSTLTRRVAADEVTPAARLSSGALVFDRAEIVALAEERAA